MLRKPITPTEIWSYRLRGKEENGTPGSELPDRFGHLSVCPHLPLAKGEKCNPCVRYEMSPMSRAAHNGLSHLPVFILTNPAVSF